MNIEFILASLLLALLPGPDILFVLAQSIGRGFKAAFSVSLGARQRAVCAYGLSCAGGSRVGGGFAGVAENFAILGSCVFSLAGCFGGARCRHRSAAAGFHPGRSFFFPLLSPWGHYEFAQSQGNYFLFILFPGIYPERGSTPGSICIYSGNGVCLRYTVCFRQRIRVGRLAE